jgi:hypothetical protein
VLLNELNAAACMQLVAGDNAKKQCNQRNECLGNHGNMAIGVARVQKAVYIHY